MFGTPQLHMEDLIGVGWLCSGDSSAWQGLLRWIVCSLYVDEAIPRGAVLQW